MKQEFTQKEVANVLHWKPKTIGFYTAEDIIVPEINNPKGRGTTRVYSRNNLFGFLVLKELTLKGVKLAFVKDIMKSINGEIPSIMAISPKEGNIYLEIYDHDINPNTVYNFIRPGEEYTVSIYELPRRLGQICGNDTFWSSLLIVNITEIVERVLKIP